VFSFIHLQFEGFLPRMWLGVVLGWLYWKTQNFWVPVVAHFANNAVQVVGQYLYHNQISSINLEEELHVPLYVAALSLAAVVWLAHTITQILNTTPPNRQTDQVNSV
jgi:membrane protease YdiL (CAAX protease family)